MTVYNYLPLKLRWYWCHRMVPELGQQKILQTLTHLKTILEESIQIC